MKIMILTAACGLFSFCSIASSANLESPVLSKVYNSLKSINASLNPNGIEPYNVFSPLMYVTCSAKETSSMFDCVESEAVQLFDLLGGTSGWGNRIERADIDGYYPQKYYDNERFPKEAMKRLLNFRNVWEKKGFLPKETIKLITKSKNIIFAYFKNSFTELEPARLGDRPSVERGIVIWDKNYKEGLILSYDSSTSELANRL
jgi:hypothetical protein